MRGSHTSLQWFSSCILAVTWVSYYGYDYNVNMFNTQIINIWAWLLWSGGGYLFLRLFNQLKGWVTPTLLLLITAWILYFTLLLFLEYIGYYVFEIKENSGGDNDLVWGLIHGSFTLHVYYTFFPFIILSVYKSVEYYSARIVKYASKTK